MARIVGIIAVAVLLYSGTLWNQSAAQAAAGASNQQILDRMARQMVRTPSAPEALTYPPKIASNSLLGAQQSRDDVIVAREFLLCALCFGGLLLLWKRTPSLSS